MDKCKYCGQEINDFDNEGDIDVCGDCIMVYSQKITFSLCLIFAAGIFFTLSFIQLLVIIFNLSIMFNQSYIFLLPPLIICISTGSLGVILIAVFKKKHFDLH